MQRIIQFILITIFYGASTAMFAQEGLFVHTSSQSDSAQSFGSYAYDQTSVPLCRCSFDDAGDLKNDDPNCEALIRGAPGDIFQLNTNQRFPGDSYLARLIDESGDVLDLYFELLSFGVLEIALPEEEFSSDSRLVVEDQSSQELFCGDVHIETAITITGNAEDASTHFQSPSSPMNFEVSPTVGGCHLNAAEENFEVTFILLLAFVSTLYFIVLRLRGAPLDETHRV